MSDNFTLHSVKIRKSVKIKELSLRIAARFQRREQAVQARIRILPTIGTDAVVAFHEQGELFHFYGKRAAEFLRSMAKSRGGDTEAPEFFERVDQPEKKFRS